VSAFLVSDAHISFIVDFANSALPKYNRLPGGAALSDPQGVGEILHKANVDSVNYRYPQDTCEPPVWQWKPSGPHAATLENLVKFLKALDCLEYQSCERNDWEESQAFKIIRTLRGMAINSLPGYDSAPWGIND
jgi:hypothetical protein